MPLIPREKGELDLRELLLIAAGTLLGSCLGVTMMCLFPVSYTHLDVYKRQVTKSDAEKGEAQGNAKLSGAGLIRLLIRGYEQMCIRDRRNLIC